MEQDESDDPVVAYLDDSRMEKGQVRYGYVAFVCVDVAI